MAITVIMPAVCFQRDGELNFSAPFHTLFLLLWLEPQLSKVTPTHKVIPLWERSRRNTKRYVRFEILTALRKISFRCVIPCSLVATYQLGWILKNKQRVSPNNWNIPTRLHCITALESFNVDIMMVNECGAADGTIIGKENRSTRRKPSPFPLYSP